MPDPAPPSSPPRDPLLNQAEYQPPPPPRWQSALFRARHVVLATYALLVAAALVWLYVDCHVDAIAGPVLLAIVLVAQAGFLAGAPHWTWPRPRRRRSMFVSKLTAALLAALLSVGLAATLLQVSDWWGPLVHHTGADRTVLFALVALWGLWGAAFLLLWTGEWLGVYRRTYKLLVAGTWLELLITIPVDVQVRKRTQCYCDEGTFLAMVIGVVMAFWSFGPGIVMLYFTRRMHRRVALNCCRVCGYDLRGLPEPRCPECGTPFDRARPTGQQPGRE